MNNRFYPTMTEKQANKSNVFWYAELENLEGYLSAEQTSLEVALEVATFWGFNPILLVGVDMGAQHGRPYSSQWRWKRCCIKPGKFKMMKETLIKKRACWPEAIYTLSPFWKGRFTRISQAGWSTILREHLSRRGQELGVTP
jgi:hypothetical protein